MAGNLQFARLRLSEATKDELIELINSSFRGWYLRNLGEVEERLADIRVRRLLKKQLEIIEELKGFESFDKEYWQLHKQFDRVSNEIRKLQCITSAESTPEQEGAE